MIIREILEVMRMDFVTVLRIYDYYPLERKIKIYVQTLTTLQLEPFGTGKASIKAELPEFRGEAFNVDGCRFLDAVGDDNIAGRLIDIEFVEVEDE